MASSSEEVLEAAVARIPEIAGIIASLPVEDRPSAFDVAAPNCSVKLRGSCEKTSSRAH